MIQITAAMIERALEAYGLYVQKSKNLPSNLGKNPIVNLTEAVNELLKQMQK